MQYGELHARYLLTQCGGGQFQRARSQYSITEQRTNFSRSTCPRLQEVLERCWISVLQAAIERRSSYVARHYSNKLADTDRNRTIILHCLR
jgi:hypothetical protein